VIVALITPVDKEAIAKYNISQSSAKLLSLSIVVPLVSVWSVLYYGYDKLRNYAQTIKESKDGEAFYDISTGLMIMVFSFPITALSSSLMGYYLRSAPQMTEELAILRNYLNLMFPLVAFYIIGRGAQKLSALLKRRSSQYSSLISIFFIFISSTFTWHVMSQIYHPGNTSNAYHLPVWMVIATIILPYLYTWHNGVVASMNIYQYQKGVKGIIYQKALKHFVAGLLVIISLSVTMQFILASSERLNRLNLSPILLILYTIVLLNVVGYGLVASSVKKLTTIEES
jgi:hypothetical protein